MKRTCRLCWALSSGGLCDLGHKTKKIMGEAWPRPTENCEKPITLEKYRADMKEMWRRLDAIRSTP